MPSKNYNPDVLSCLANLSNDEVFTPPKIANQMLDTLPAELWSNKNAKFLDPVSKSGVFLREIAKRLLVGLEKQIPDQQERINHIFQNQLYGIAITEITSLLSRRSVYCSKLANGKYSVCDTFTDIQWNIHFEQIEHTWKNGKCTYCWASQGEHDRSEDLETHAYQFIHTNKLSNLFPMKFDVIIGNPPYQLDTLQAWRQAKPIYHLFIEQAKKLEPRFLTMIVPSRWFAGGMGLDDFRAGMLGDKRIRKITDFENASDVFPWVDIAGGVCYFLWDRDNQGLCEVTNFYNGSTISSERPLDEFQTFIRNGKAVPIIRKIHTAEIWWKFLNSRVSPMKPFGLATNYDPQKKGTPCWFIQKTGLKFANSNDVNDRHGMLQKWKLLIPKAPIAGQTDFSKPVGFYYDGNVRIAKPWECCTESWIVACAFDTEEEVISFKSYLFTKTVRFLLLQAVVSQDVTREKFLFVPDLGKYKGEYTDDMLRKRWGITQEEWEFIDSRIK